MTDYTTGQLIDRLYKSLDQNDTPRTTKLMIDPPIVAMVNGQTCFKNFTSTCENLKRNVADVKKYFEEEMCVTSSIDGSGILLIDGKFRSNNIEKVLLNYMEHYVFCKECKSANTKLERRERIQFMECGNCKSSRGL